MRTIPSLQAEKENPRVGRKAKGLEPLATEILLCQQTGEQPLILAEKYVDPEKQVENAEQALAGAKDIIAESVSDNADVRRRVRNLVYLNGFIESSAAKDEKKRLRNLL